MGDACPHCGVTRNNQVPGAALALDVPAPVPSGAFESSAYQGKEQTSEPEPRSAFHQRTGGPLHMCSRARLWKEEALVMAARCSDSSQVPGSPLAPSGQQDRREPKGR